MAKIIFTNGTEKKVMPKNGTDFSLEELQGFVKGYIEIVYLPNDKFLVVNEEGKLMGLPINDYATEIANQLIVGDVLLCDSDQIK